MDDGKDLGAQRQRDGCRNSSRIWSGGDSDSVTVTEPITCARAARSTLTNRHNTLTMYARRCEWKMHLQGPWPVSRVFKRLFLDPHCLGGLKNRVWLYTIRIRFWLHPLQKNYSSSSDNYNTNNPKWCGRRVGLVSSSTAFISNVARVVSKSRAAQAKDEGTSSRAARLTRYLRKAGRYLRW